MFNSHTDELDQKIKKQREELSTLQQAADSVLQILNIKKPPETKKSFQLSYITGIHLL